MGAKQSSYKSPPPPSNIPQKNNTSNVSITLDEAYESLEDYKQVINNVYCVSKLLDDYSEEIHDKMEENDDNPINSVLSELLHDEYDKNKDDYFCEIIELTKYPNELGNCRYLFSCKKYEELDGLSLMNIKTSNISQTIDNLSYMNISALLEARLIEMCRKIPMYGKMYLHSGFNIWTKGVTNYFNLIRKHPVISDKWIVISSGLPMKNYSNKTETNLQSYSIEFKTLMANITQVMNSNIYLQIIEDSLEEAQHTAEEAITLSEEKGALYNFSKKVLENAPNDIYAKQKEQESRMEAQNASRLASNAVTNAKAAQYALTEAETSIATKTTTWEYGPESEFDNLRCVFSGIHPQWNGLHIKDCTIHGNKYNISEITFNVISDIEHYYPELSNNQTLLSTYKTDYGYHIAVVKIIKHGDDVHFQMKEADLNTIFGEVNEQYEPETSSTLSNKPHIFLDPSTYFVGIGTNERVVKYANEYITTKNHNFQHVVIKSNTYPNLVGVRNAESSRHIQRKGKNNYYYFDQFSAATMRRESNLYSFDELWSHTEDASEEENYPKKYGPDISFEITDKNKVTNEIGNIGMVIDKIGEQGEIYGGLSIKTKPNLINNNGQQNVKPGNTIMYVSSDGLLHISGIMLGNKVLSVKNEDETEHLYWGDDKIC